MSAPIPPIRSQMIAQMVARAARGSAPVMPALERGVVTPQINPVTRAIALMLQHRKASVDPSMFPRGTSWGLVTATNPAGQEPLDAATNAARHGELEMLLRGRNRPEDIAPTQGGWRDDAGREYLDPGFFVYGMKPNEALELGRRFGQGAVMTSEGMHTLFGEGAGSKARAVGSRISRADDPYFTQFDHPFAGPVRVSTDFNFDSSRPDLWQWLSSWNPQGRAQP